MTNFDVLAEIDSWLNRVTKIEEPSVEPKFGEQPIGRVTFDKTKRLYTISVQIARKRQEIIAELDELAEALNNLSKSVYSNSEYRKLMEHARQLHLLSSATDYLFSISLRTEVSARLETELGIRVEWRIILSTREVEKYIPPGLKTETQQ
ncbi:MAG: hypothetical protein Q7R89_02220 [bacterium]|nr:hypothetical protein [bacterium]